MRLEISYSLKNRGEDINNGAKLLNGFSEIKNGVPRGIKRPALAGAFTVATGGGSIPTVGQTLFVVNTPGVPGGSSGTSTTGTTGSTAVGGNVVTSGAALTLGGATGGAGVGTGWTSGTNSNIIVIRGDTLTNAPVLRPSRIAFAVGPSSSGPGLVMTPAPVVYVYNIYGAVMTGYVGTVTVRLGPINLSNGTLSGTLAVNAIAGVATFSNLIVDRLGAYTLIASIVI